MEEERGTFLINSELSRGIKKRKRTGEENKMRVSRGRKNQINQKPKNRGGSKIQRKKKKAERE